MYGLYNYTVFKCDRNALTSSFSRGGGVLIAVRIEFASNIIPITNSNVEHIFVKCIYNDSSYVVSSAYIPPNSSTHLYDSYLSAVQSVINDNPNILFLFCGDFNLPDITWSNNNLELTYSSTSDIRINCLPETFAFLNY